MTPNSCGTGLPYVSRVRNDGRKEHDQKATPDQGTGMPTGGLAGRKEHDRLMATVNGRARVAPPTICPACGLSTDNGVLARSELTSTATYCCTSGHLYSVTWLEEDA